MAFIIRRLGHRQWLQGFADDGTPLFTPFRNGAVRFELERWARDFAHAIAAKQPHLKLQTVKV